MPCRAESVGAVILPKAHSEEGCLESLKLQSLVVTRVFLLWIRVCSRDCRERRRSERRRKEGGREERGEEKSPLTFCTNFTPLSRCYRRRRRTRRARTTPSSTQLFTARKKTARCAAGSLGRLRERGYGTGDSRGNAGRQTTISQTKSSHG